MTKIRIANMTLLQIINYLFIKLRYKLTQAVPNYNIEIGQTIIVFIYKVGKTEKLQGEVISINRIEDEVNGDFIINVYEVYGKLQGHEILNSYLIDDSEIVCVFNIN